MNKTDDPSKPNDMDTNPPQAKANDRVSRTTRQTTSEKNGHSDADAVAAHSETTNHKEHVDTDTQHQKKSRRLTHKSLPIVGKQNNTTTAIADDTIGSQNATPTKDSPSGRHSPPLDPDYNKKKKPKQEASEKPANKRKLYRKKKSAQEQKEELEKSHVIITELNEYDVLVGRGSGIQQFLGNRHFRCVVWQHKIDYLALPPTQLDATQTHTQKKDIGRIVVENIASKGGRFLQCLGHDQYREITNEQALEKTCQALRERKADMPAEYPLFQKGAWKPHLVLDEQKKVRRGKGGIVQDDEDEDASSDRTCIKALPPSVDAQLGAAIAAVRRDMSERAILGLKPNPLPKGVTADKVAAAAAKTWSRPNKPKQLLSKLLANKEAVKKSVGTRTSKRRNSTSSKSSSGDKNKKKDATVSKTLERVLTEQKQEEEEEVPRVVIKTSTTTRSGRRVTKSSKQLETEETAEALRNHHHTKPWYRNTNQKKKVLAAAVVATGTNRVQNSDESEGSNTDDSDTDPTSLTTPKAATERVAKRSIADLLYQLQAHADREEEEYVLPPQKKPKTDNTTMNHHPSVMASGMDILAAAASMDILAAAAASATPSLSNDDDDGMGRELDGNADDKNGKEEGEEGEDKNVGSSSKMATNAMMVF